MTKFRSSTPLTPPPEEDSEEQVNLEGSDDEDGRTGRVGVYDRPERRTPAFWMIVVAIVLVLLALYLAIYVVPSLFFTGT